MQAREPKQAQEAYENDHLLKYITLLINKILASARQFN